MLFAPISIDAPTDISSSTPSRPPNAWNRARVAQSQLPRVVDAAVDRVAEDARVLARAGVAVEAALPRLRVWSSTGVIFAMRGGPFTPAVSIVFARSWLARKPAHR